MLPLIALLVGLHTALPALAQPSVPVPVLRIELNDTPMQVPLGSMLRLTFTIRNLVSGTDFVFSPRYRIAGTATNFEGDTRDVLHASFLSSDSVTYQLRAAIVGHASFTLSVDYVECPGGGSPCAPRTTTQAFSLDVVQVSGPTPTAPPTGVTPTATAIRSPSATPTVTATPSPARGLRFDLAVYPPYPVVGDLVSFVFTVRNPEAEVTATRPTYTLIGTVPNFGEGSLSETHELVVAGPQTDTVVFRLNAVQAGITQLRVEARYVECRPNEGCHSGSTLSPIYEVGVRGSALTPIATPSPEQSSTSLPTLTPTPTLTLNPALTPTPTLTLGLAPTATPSLTARVVSTAALTFEISLNPPQPVVDDLVTVTFTIRNPEGPATVRRETYTVSGVAPNFDGSVAPITHDVPILGAQADVVTYQLHAVHEGETLFQIHVTYEVCADTLPCPSGFTSSQIFPIAVVAVIPTPSPTQNLTPVATSTPAPTITATPGLAPLLTYELVVTPPQPFVGDDVDFVFTVRNAQTGTLALRPSYQVTGTAPNFEGPITALNHDVAIGGDSFDVVTLRFAAVHEGTTLLQLHTSYDACTAAGDSCSSAFSSSPIFPVVVSNPPTATPTVTSTATASPSSTSTPSPTPRSDGTLTATPSPTATVGFVGTFSDGDCALTAMDGRRRGGLLALLLPALGLLWLRSRTDP